MNNTLSRRVVSGALAPTNQLQFELIEAANVWYKSDPGPRISILPYKASIVDVTVYPAKG